MTQTVYDDIVWQINEHMLANATVQYTLVVHPKIYYTLRLMCSFARESPLK